MIAAPRRRTALARTAAILAVLVMAAGCGDAGKKETAAVGGGSKPKPAIVYSPVQGRLVG